MWCRTARLVTVIAFVAVASACEKSDAPSGLLTGTWSGTAIEGSRGQGAIRLTLDHRGGVVDGSLQTTFDGVMDRDGPVHGISTGSDVTLTYVPREPLQCGATGTLTGTVTMALRLADGKLVGGYSQFTCTAAVTATVTLTRS